MPNPYFVFDEKLCKVEGMTKEQIMNAIAQATGVTPSDVDAGFISTILENNRSRNLHIWKGTRAEYNALTSKSSSTLYIIEDDTTIADFEAHLDEIDETCSSVADIVSEISADTGWLDIFRNNLESEPQKIGEYRIIGKIAFFKFSYTVSNFREHDYGFDSFTLPINIGALPVNGFTIIGSSTPSSNVTNKVFHAEIYNNSSNETVCACYSLA